MDTLLQDLKFALRMLRKSPSITAVTVLTLALAIGATTSIFSAVSAVLLRPLPFPDPDSLIALQDVEAQGTPHGFSWAEFTDLRSQAPDLAGLAAYRQETANLAGYGEPRVVTTTMVTEGFFDVLGVKPVAGRFFNPEEQVPNAAPALVATESFWHDVLGGVAPGTVVQLDGVQFVLAGVVSQPAASSLFLTEAFLPLERKIPWTDRGNHYLETVGRLRPGISLARARTDLAVAGRRIAEAAKENHVPRMVSLQDFVFGEAQPLLLLLLAAVGIVLSIASVNLASVALSRTTGRAREFAVRRALGASGARLARQLVVETAAMANAGGALGLVFALWGRDLVLQLWPASLPRIASAPLDWRVLAFATAVSVGAGAGIGLLPAVQASRGDLQTGLREGAGASARGRARSMLVVLQSALAVVLLVSAALVLRSLSQMIDRGPGFHVRNALSVRVPLPPAKYAKEQRIRFFRQLLDSVSRIEGVRAAGVVSRLPLGGGSTDGNYSVIGRPPVDPDHEPYADRRVVSEGYFAAMQIPILRGRPFADSDAAPEIVINEALARREFPGEDPIGKQIAQGSNPGHDPATVVGVAADVKQHRLNREALSEIYYPESRVGQSEMDLVVRTDGDPKALLPAIKAQVALLDPAQPVTKVRTIEEVLERNAGPERLAGELLGAFAAAALLLAALGIYGVVSYAVSRREREIGVRMALGAEAGDVLRMMLREGLRLSLAGVLCGTFAAIALARLLSRFLYGVSPRDPAAYAVAAVGLLLVAAAATLLPARRATKVDPAISLRAE
jgi:putative ABC transport system permease protein